MTDISAITLEAIRARHAALSDAILRTPTIPLASPRLAEATGATLWAKLECLQNTGTFKARGALSNIRASAAPGGITAVSAGNHAIAAAWAAKVTGVSAKVVMQNTANPYRVALARAYGAEVVLCDPGAPSFAEAERLRDEEGRLFIHPFEGENVALGTGGLGLELIEDAGPLDAVIVACGGGGLLSGVAAAVRQISPETKVFGVEPEGADSMSRSLAAGAPVTLQKTETIADSLAPPMALPMGFALVREYVERIVTVSDDQIRAGQVVALEEAKLALEPAAGAVFAALLGPLRDRVAGARVGLVVCGANIDADSFADQIEKGRGHVDALWKR